MKSALLHAVVRLVLVLLPVAAMSQEVPAEVKRYAVVIGVREYEFPQKNALLFADKDAENLADFLKTEEGGGFPPGNVHILTNKKATKRDIIREIDGLSKVNADDIVYIFFSGHGVVDDQGRAYLMPYDAMPELPADRGLQTDWFLKYLRAKIPAENLILFIDACHAGSALNEGGVAKGSAPSISPRLKDEWEQIFADRKKNEKAASFAILSAGSNQDSWEAKKLGAGVFTHFLLEGLQWGEANQPPHGDKDKAITAGELYSYLYAKVPEYTIEEFRQPQTPIISADFDGSFTLALVAPGGRRNRRPRVAVATAPPSWDGPFFPLLPDPPNDAWPSGFDGDESRRLLMEAKGFLERVDLVCAAPPSFGLFPPSGQGTRAETGSETTTPYLIVDNWARAAFEAANRSLELSENPWAYLYRGLALARLRAFRGAHTDLERAAKDFRDAGRVADSQIAARFRGLVREWEKPLTSNPPEVVSRPGCGPAGSRTVCELASRIDWAVLSPAEKRSQVDRLRSFLEAPPCAKEKDCTPLAPKAELSCSNLLANAAGPELAAEIHRIALDYALRRDLVVEAGEHAENLFLALLRAGRPNDADRVLRERRELWSPYERASIGLRAALEPAAQGNLAARVELLEIEPDLQRDFLTLQADSAEIRDRLARLGSALETAAAGHDEVLYYLLDTGKSSKWAIHTGPGASSREDEPGPDRELLAKELSDLLGKVRATLGAETLDGLPALVERFLRTLERIAHHAKGSIELGEFREELTPLIPTLRDHLASLPGSSGASIALANTAFAIASFSAYDAPLREDDPDPEWSSGFLALLTGGASAEMQPYRQAFALASLVVRALLPAEAVQTLSDGLMTSNDETDAFSRAVNQVMKCSMQDLPEGKSTACIMQTVWRWLEEVERDPKAAIFFPVASAHRRAKQEMVAEIGSVPAGEGGWDLYLHLLGEALTEDYLAARPGELTIAQRDFLLMILSSLTFLSILDEEAGAPAESATFIERIAQQPQIDPEQKEATRDLLTLVRLVRSLDGGPTESSGARKALSELRQPFYKTFALALPATYAGLSPDEIHSLLIANGLGSSGGSPGLLELAIGLALLFDSGTEEPLLHYDQKATMADLLLEHIKDLDVYLQIPIGTGFAPFGGEVNPLAFPSSNCRDTEAELKGGFSVTDSGGLFGFANCICCKWAPLAVSALCSQAVHEKLWPEVERWLDWLQEKTDPVEEGWIGDAAASILQAGEGVPPDLRRFAASELLATIDTGETSLGARLDWTAALAAGFTSGPESEHGITRETLKEHLLQVSHELAKEPIPADEELTFLDWFNYLDEVGRSFSALKDPELVFLWRRQTRTLRGLLASLPWPAPGSQEAEEIAGSPLGQTMQSLEQRITAGDAHAMTHLGWILSNTLSPGRDEARALTLLTKAAESKDREAMQHLALLLARPGADAAQGSQAVEWLQRSAGLGNAEALTSLGRLYLEGRAGGQRDPEFAFQWFQKAAEAGSVAAMNELGILYAQGVGVSLDFAAAAQWFQRAADYGHTAARANLEALTQPEP